jgi:adenylate kinase family enzyme
VPRIHILGAADSGKTTLAAQVAERLAAPWYELDTIGY